MLHLNVVLICSIESKNKICLAIVSSKQNKKNKKISHFLNLLKLMGLIYIQWQENLVSCVLIPRKVLYIHIYDKIFWFFLRIEKIIFHLLVLLPKVLLTQSKYLMAIKKNGFRNTTLGVTKQATIYISFGLEPSYSQYFCFLFC